MRTRAAKCENPGVQLDLNIITERWNFPSFRGEQCLKNDKRKQDIMIYNVL